LLAGRTGERPWRPECGDEHVDDLPELVDRAAHIPPLAGDLDVGLVDLPAIPDTMPAGSGNLGQQWREPLHPPVDGDVIGFDAPLGEQFLDIALGQPEAQVPADGYDDHVGSEAEAGEGGARDWSSARAAGCHASSLAARTRSQRMQQRPPVSRTPRRPRPEDVVEGAGELRIPIADVSAVMSAAGLRAVGAICGHTSPLAPSLSRGRIT